LGISSLHFNHHFSFMEAPNDPEHWSQKIMPGPEQNDLLLSETIRDSLSLIGWPLPWETRRDSTGGIHFALEQPGKRYVIDYATHDQIAHVAETPKGFWRVFNALHGSGIVPGAPLMYAWSWYTRITVVVILFSVFSGLYLWIKGQQNRQSGLIMLFTCCGITLTWMVQLYLNG
jgi:hypothetical protein